MKFGFTAPTFPPAEGMVRVARRLEELGAHSIWFPDHLMGFYPQSIWTAEFTPMAERFKSPHMFYEAFASAAYVAANTSKLVIGIGVTEVFRRHPAVLLQQAITIDHISGGRFILGLGSGEAENIVPYGIEFKRPVSRLEEALRLMRLMLEADIGETVSFEGRFFRLRDAVLDIKPVGKLPIWLGAHGDRMLELTARYADGWIPTYLPPKVYRERAEKLDALLDRVGRGGMLDRAMYAPVVVDEDEREVERLLGNPLLKIHAILAHPDVYRAYGLEHPLGDYFGVREFIPTRVGREEILKITSKIPVKAVKLSMLAGTPREVVEEIKELQEAGLEHMVFWNVTYFPDPSKVKSSYEMLYDIVKQLGK